MADDSSRYNFILTADDRASKVFEGVNGKLNAFDMAAGKAERSLMGFASGLSGTAMIAGSAVVTLGAVAASVLEMAKGTAEYEAKLGHLSERLGVSTEYLSKMQYAAEMNGVEFDKMTKGIQRMEVVIGKSRLGEQSAILDGESISVNKASKAFDQLGISLNNADGTAKSTEEVTLELADKLSQVHDGATRAALASQIFGAKNLDLIQILVKGREAMQEYFDEAEQHGLVVTEEAKKKALEYEEANKRLEASFKSLKMSVGEYAIPAMTEFTNRTDDFISRLKEAHKEGSLLNQILHELDNTGDIFGQSDIDKKFERKFSGTAYTGVAPNIFGDTSNPLGPSQDNIDKANDAWRKFQEQGLDPTEQKLEKLADQAMAVAEAMEKAGQDPQPVWDELDRQIARVQANNYKFKVSTFDMAKTMEDVYNATGRGADALDRYNAELELTALEQDKANLEAAGFADGTWEQRDALQALIDKLYEANLAYSAGDYSLGGLINTLSKAKQKEDELAESAKKAADAVGGGFNNMMNPDGTFNTFYNPFGSGPAAGYVTPGYGGSGIGYGPPMMAEGGIVRRATLAVVGEAGPEAVIPLSKMASMGGVTVSGNTIQIISRASNAAEMAVEVDVELAKLVKDERSQLGKVVRAMR